MAVPENGIELQDAIRQLSRRDKRRLQLADALCAEYPKLLKRAGIPPDTCILAVRIGMEVCQQLGYRTKPMPVKVTAHNAAAVALRDQGITPDESGDHGKAFEVMLGFSPDEQTTADHYNGHLIFVVDEQLAVDLTAHQLAALTHELDVEALYFPVTPEFMRGDEALGLTHPQKGWRVIYGPRPQDKDWAAATDFHAKDYSAMFAQTTEITKLLKRDYGVKPATRGRR